MAAVRNVELGRALRQMREERHLSRTELAEALGVARNQITVIELGLRTPRPDLLARIATVLNVVDYFALARLAGYLPGPTNVSVYTVTTDSLEKAAWLRQFEARFDASELETLYRFSMQWQPRAEAATVEQPAARSRSA